MMKLELENDVGRTILCPTSLFDFSHSTKTSFVHIKLALPITQYFTLTRRGGQRSVDGVSTYTCTCKYLPNTCRQLEVDSLEWTACNFTVS